MVAPMNSGFGRPPGPPKKLKVGTTVACPGLRSAKLLLTTPDDLDGEVGDDGDEDGDDGVVVLDGGAEGVVN